MKEVLSNDSTELAEMKSKSNLRLDCLCRIRDLEAQISVLQDKVAVDEIKLNLVMSYENQILMNNHQSETVLELQKKMEDKDKEIRNLRKRLRIEEGFESEDRSKVSMTFSLK